MGKTSIEWTDASWNPVVGCTEVSPGCANCYAARLAATRLKTNLNYRGLSLRREMCDEHGCPLENGRCPKCRDAKGHSFVLDMQSRCLSKREHWTGEIRTLPERLAEPASWRKPRRIFVCDMGDLFHESVPHGFLIEVFRAMAAAPQHTYQILTKRAERMREWLTAFALVEKHHPLRDDCRWPWPNVWCGVSVENQHFADERIPLLLQTPAAVRWISAEPLLGAIRFKAEWVDLPYARAAIAQVTEKQFPTGLDWVVCGGESGPGARPMHPDWARSLRDQCQAAGVPFFFKQWGEWGISYIGENVERSRRVFLRTVTQAGNLVDTGMVKVGKKKAGRLLDGREWNQFPEFVQLEGVMMRCEQ